MAHRLTFTYSRLSASSVDKLVADHYDIDGPLHSRFYVLGLHDNYLIESAGASYIFRVYRNDWRTSEDIHFELELLDCLQAEKAPVAWPVQTIGQEHCIIIDTPEGERMAALFHFAEGRAPGSDITPDICLSLGRAVSKVHQSARSFVTDRFRPVLDYPFLVDDSIRSIKPFLDHDTLDYVDGLKERLRLNWPDIPKEEDMFGVCIGDVNTTNFHITDSGKVTLFDFDQCGFGYRAFEIAKFASSIHSFERKRTLLDAFLDGYQKEMPLTDVELEAIPFSERVAKIWVLAIHAKNVDRIGNKRLEKPFWDKNISLIKALESQ